MSNNDNNTLYCETGIYWDWDYDPHEVPTREYFIQPFDNESTGRYKTVSGDVSICPSCDGTGHVEVLQEKFNTYVHVICRACDGLGILRG